MYTMDFDNDPSTATSTQLFLGLLILSPDFTSSFCVINNPESN